MLLWHMHSKVLAGFYASEVYVAAASQSDAVQLAVDAFDIWLKNEVENYWFNPLTYAQPDDPGYEHAMAQLRVKFIAEAITMLKQVPNNAIILRKT